MMAPATVPVSKPPHVQSYVNGTTIEHCSPYGRRLEKDEIRLAEIKATKSEIESVVCSLCTVPRVDPSRKYSYRALSYSWGPANERDQGHIYLEIKGQRIRWPVTLTLEAALRRLRYCADGEPLMIWVDALCINQKDVEELGDQVEQMRVIYQNASEVSIWLGPEDKTSPDAWRLIRNLEKCNGHTDELQLLIESSQEKDFTALVALFRREYFWRIWVVQEVACAKKAVVLCGSEVMLWTELVDVGRKIAAAKKIIRDSIYHDKPATLFSLMGGGPKNLSLTLSSQGPFSEGNAPSLLNLLLSHRIKGSTNPHDKVYGLVGMSAERELFGHIDYKRSPRATYIHTAYHLISTANKLNVICLKQNDDDRFHLPSWVPDWERRNLYPSHRVFGLHIRKPPFAASRDEPANATFLEDKEVLSVQGFVVDVIAKAAKSCYVEGPESEVTPTLKVFHNWWSVFMDNIGPEELSVFQRTLCGGSWAPDYLDIQEDLTERLYLFFGLLGKLLPGILNNGRAAPEFRREETMEADVLEKRQYTMVSSAALRMHAKRLIISRTKLTGLAPMTAEEGDKIVVLLGCDFPVVMRDMGSYWKLIGEIYVDGIMYGDAMDGMTFGKYTKRTFEVR